MERQYIVRVTIKNNSSFKIKSWKASFYLKKEEIITHSWDIFIRRTKEKSIIIPTSPAWGQNNEGGTIKSNETATFGFLVDNAESATNSIRVLEGLKAWELLKLTLKILNLRLIIPKINLFYCDQLNSKFQFAKTFLNKIIHISLIKLSIDTKI